MRWLPIPWWLRRVAAAVPVVGGVTAVVFVALRSIPGGPWDREKELPEAVMRNLAVRADLDAPVAVQYLRWLWRTLQLDLDTSIKFPAVPVSEILASALPVSVSIGLLAALLVFSGGISLGVNAARRPDGWLDRSVDVAATLAFAMPTFVLATLFAAGVGVGLGWLPPGLWEGPQYAILPILVLAIGPGAWIAELMRGAMRTQLQMPWIQAARARGLSEFAVVWRHAVPNALTPVLGAAGPVLAWLLTGSFVVEQVFALPGLGRWFVSAIIDRDYPVVMGTTLVFSVVVVGVQIGVDALQAMLDPRIEVDR